MYVFVLICLKPYNYLYFDLFVYLEISLLFFIAKLFQMENQVILSDYTQMDRALKEERTYLLDLCKQIKKAGCNVLLIQKSILRYFGVVSFVKCDLVVFL